MNTYTLHELNQMGQNEFVEALGSIFEYSPWVAERAWAAQPFVNKAKLHQSMIAVVEQISNDEKIALFRQHPDLASRLQMTEFSVKEQQGAGLTSLSPEEYSQFRACNEAYVNKFGFPFIIAVKGKSKEIILEAMRSRVHCEPDREIQQALQEIANITRFRIEDKILDHEW